jgi:hypothetical protein
VRSNFVLIFLLSLRCWTQATTGQASTDAPCSIANSGSDNKIQINCGIGKDQGQKMIAILNKILADRLDADVVMAKLDEILHAVNPNLPTKAYFCNGSWRSIGIGANSGMQMNANFAPDPSLAEMANLTNTNNQYEKLLKVCSFQIESNPDWLTPRLFCAIAYRSLGNTAKAKEMLEAYDARKGPAYDGDDNCKKISDFLHANLR